MICSFLATLALAENAFQDYSLGDGIGITNPMAYAIIGEDGWSTQLFNTYFSSSAVFSLLLLMAYFVARRKEKTGGKTILETK